MNRKKESEERSQKTYINNQTTALQGSLQFLCDFPLPPLTSHKPSINREKQGMKPGKTSTNVIKGQ